MRLQASLIGCAVLLLTACASSPVPAPQQIASLGQLGAAYIAAGGDCEKLVEQYRESDEEPAVAACGDSTELVFAADEGEAQRVATERQLQEQTVLVRDRWVIRDPKVAELQAVMGGEIVTLSAADGPANMADAIVFGSDGAAELPPVPAGGTPTVSQAGGDLPQVLVVLDAMCEYCSRFLATNDSLLQSLADDGSASVAYLPVSLGDKGESGFASALGANALACVADAAPDAYQPFQTELLANLQEQPFDAEAVTQLAADAGAEVGECIKAARFAWWVRQATLRAIDEPLQGVEPLRGVPTVMVDGEVFAGDVSDPVAFRDFVEAQLG